MPSKPISEDQNRLEPPAEVVRIARTLTDAGFETWCVGGAIRDALLGLHHLDWDLATAAPPLQVRKLFRRTIPVGVEFGTVGVLGKSGRMYEVTTFRKDVRTDGRHAEVEFGVSLDDDLARRDFTINAIAYNPVTHEWRDPFGGRNDLSREVVRAVGVAADRMREDRLRALRAIRFGARFSFAIEAATWSAICESAPHLTRLSPERVKQEMEKTMEQVRTPSAAFRLWHESGALSSLVPSLAAVSDSVLEAVDRVPVPRGNRSAWRRTLRITVLFSDLSGSDAARALKALRFSNRDIEYVSTLINHWQKVGVAMYRALVPGADAISDSGSVSGAQRVDGRARNTGVGTGAGAVVVSDTQLRRWVAAVGRLRVADVMRVAWARWQAGTVPPPADSAVRALYRRLRYIAWHAPVELADLAVDGEDLKNAGVPRGPRLGAVLRALMDAVIENPALNTRDTLLAKVSELLVAQHATGKD